MGALSVAVGVLVHFEIPHEKMCHFAFSIPFGSSSIRIFKFNGKSIILQHTLTARSPFLLFICAIFFWPECEMFHILTFLKCIKAIKCVRNGKHIHITIKAAATHILILTLTFGIRNELFMVYCVCDPNCYNFIRCFCSVFFSFCISRMHDRFSFILCALLPSNCDAAEICIQFILPVFSVFFRFHLNGFSSGG